MTGTRFMNLNMIPFENQVADYVKKTKKHVRYRVTPVFKDKDLVAQGVIMEAMSVEDNGASVKYNVFIYNYQKGVTIDYKTGKYTLK
jgi:DNA-entry nuclease